jgi:ketosteroid isomerase-like protein
VTASHGVRTLVVIVGVLGASARLEMSAQEGRSAAQDRTAIERLHRQDVEATLSDRADDLVQLWDPDAVRLQQSRPAEVGRDTIYAADKHWETTKTGQSLSYTPDIQDLQIAGDWAFEWGYFDASYKESANAEPLAVRGKQLRILKRQQDGSWRFARVMSVIDSRGPAEIKR